jgi:hypothetical protein
LVWRFLATQLDLPVPAIVHVECDERRGQFGVVLEYVEPAEDAAPLDEEACRLVGGALASVHRRFWGAADGLPDVFRPASGAEAAGRIEPGIRRFLDRMSGERQAVLYAAVPQVLGFLAKLLRMDEAFFVGSGELKETLIHGGMDAAEVLFRRRGGGLQPVFIGWDAARIGEGSEDLASFSASVGALPGGEALGAAAVDAYLAEMSAAGIAIGAKALGEEIVRQSAVLWGRNLPQLCSQFLDRKDQPAHEPWCTWFVDSAARQVAGLIPMLQKLKPAHPEPPPDL